MCNVCVLVKQLMYYSDKKNTPTHSHTHTHIPTSSDSEYTNTQIYSNSKCISGMNETDKIQPNTLHSHLTVKNNKHY